MPGVVRPPTTVDVASRVSPRLAPAPPLLIDLVRLARPYSMLWFVAVPMATMAIWLRGPNLNALDVATVIVVFALTDAGLTTYNDICDRDTDSLSAEDQRRTRPLVEGRVSVRTAYMQFAVLELAAVAGALLLSPWLAALIAAGAIYGIGYSMRGVRLSGRPYVSQIFWLLCWPGVYVAVFLAVGGDWLRGLPYVAATVVFMGVGETLAKDLRDLRNDAAAGKRTTPVALGSRAAATAAVAAFVVGTAGYVAAALSARPGDPRLAIALAVVLALWCGRASLLAAKLRTEYDSSAARAMHVGSIRVFLTLNLLFVAGL